jgi:glyoxylase-like metal-dependent hydrolase (beta-lactamase superfamily II)
MVRRPDHAPLLMVGDLTYDADLLAAGPVPGAGSKRRMRDAVAAVNALRQRRPDLAVLAAHDPTATDRLVTALAADLIEP